ncbi:hypothetical protein SAMN05414139_05718 [Burkholderia sp. D7]|nr:hypothetical protein SAMN05414139_05718 [Burkholderia sp. D7]
MEIISNYGATMRNAVSRVSKRGRVETGMLRVLCKVPIARRTTGGGRLKLGGSRLTRLVGQPPRRMPDNGITVSRETTGRRAIERAGKPWVLDALICLRCRSDASSNWAPKSPTTRKGICRRRPPEHGPPSTSLVVRCSKSAKKTVDVALRLDAICVEIISTLIGESGCRVDF